VQAAQNRLRQAEQIYKADKEAYEEAQDRAQADCPVDTRLKKQFQVGWVPGAGLCAGQCGGAWMRAGQHLLCGGSCAVMHPPCEQL
jgi:hypothetical protein